MWQELRSVLIWEFERYHIRSIPFHSDVIGQVHGSLRLNHIIVAITDLSKWRKYFNERMVGLELWRCTTLRCRMLSRAEKRRLHLCTQPFWWGSTCNCTEDYWTSDGRHSIIEKNDCGATGSSQTEMACSIFTSHFQTSSWGLLASTAPRLDCSPELEPENSAFGCFRFRRVTFVEEDWVAVAFKSQQTELKNASKCEWT